MIYFFDFGFDFGFDKNKNKAIACLEIISKHGIFHQIPKEITVGEKITVKGMILKPYKFDRITLAWEAYDIDKDTKDSTPKGENSNDITTYFPPLDYVAYANKSQAHHETAVNTLKTLGMIAAVAGGMFIPPVALVAPLIAMSGSNTISEPKQQSDIPLHGGIKVEGQVFSGNIQVSNHGKQGLYYVSIWARQDNSAKLICVSRRTVIAKLPDNEEVNGIVEKSNN